VAAPSELDFVNLFD